MRKIVLVCAAGMSTSLLVNKMRSAADEQSYEVEIDAYPIAEVEQIAQEADVVLLGPQVRHQIEDVKNLVSCPVESIDMRAYGIMDGKAVIKRVKEILGD